MLNILRKRKSVDHIVSGFHRVLDDLDELQERKLKEAQRHSEKVAHHQQRKSEAYAEVTKAQRIQSNINKLLTE